jgi:DNA-binding IclR family transcriptional regulator
MCKKKNVPTINVVFKTFRLIELLCEPTSEYSMTEFSKELDMSVGSIQRITNSLISLGYLAKDPKTKKYRLTKRWLPIGFSILAGLEIRKIALPHLKQLYKETSQTVSLALRDDSEVIYVERLLTPHLIGFNIRPGLKRPMYPNSIGRAILAFLPKQEKDKLIDRTIEMSKSTQKPLDRSEIEAKLAQIKQAGYTVHRVQFSGGALAVAVPIFDHLGAPIAGINIGMPPNIAPDNDIFQTNIQLLKKAGEAISSELGFVGYSGE